MLVAGRTNKLLMFTAQKFLEAQLFRVAMRTCTCVRVCVCVQI